MTADHYSIIFTFCGECDPALRTNGIFCILQEVEDNFFQFNLVTGKIAIRGMIFEENSILLSAASSEIAKDTAIFFNSFSMENTEW